MATASKPAAKTATKTPPTKAPTTSNKVDTDAPATKSENATTTKTKVRLAYTIEVDTQKAIDTLKCGRTAEDIRIAVRKALTSKFSENLGFPAPIVRFGKGM